MSFRKASEKPSTGGTPCLLKTTRLESPGGEVACNAFKDLISALNPRFSPQQMMHLNLMQTIEADRKQTTRFSDRKMAAPMLKGTPPNLPSGVICIREENK